eukprot:COSAG05_NODE_648_length_8105_cov_23.780914_5_plen_67_part_00
MRIWSHRKSHVRPDSHMRIWIDSALRSWLGHVIEEFLGLERANRAHVNDAISSTLYNLSERYCTPM